MYTQAYLASSEINHSDDDVRCLGDVKYCRGSESYVDPVASCYAGDLVLFCLAVSAGVLAVSCGDVKYGRGSESFVDQGASCFVLFCLVVSAGVLAAACGLVLAVHYHLQTFC